VLHSLEGTGVVEPPGVALSVAEGVPGLWAFVAAGEAEGEKVRAGDGQEEGGEQEL
jgi:hypothetical protein